MKFTNKPMTLFQFHWMLVMKNLNEFKFVPGQYITIRANINNEDCKDHIQFVPHK